MVLETVYVDLQVPAEPCPGSSIPPPRHPGKSLGLIFPEINLLLFKK